MARHFSCVDPKKSDTGITATQGIAVDGSAVGNSEQSGDRLCLKGRRKQQRRDKERCCAEVSGIGGHR